MTWSWKDRQGSGHTESCRSMIKAFRFYLRVTEGYWRDLNEILSWSDLYVQIIVLAPAWRIDSRGAERRLGEQLGRLLW